MTDIQVPDYLANTYDAVNYEVIENGKVQKFNGSACYANHMERLEKITVRCKPYQNFKLSIQDFNYWINNCKDNNIIPDGVTVDISKKDPTFEINGTKSTKFHIYSALCCFRFADTSPRLVYEFNRLYDELKDEVDFFQILGFCFNKHITNNNHSFSVCCKHRYYGCKEADDIVYSVCSKWVFYFLKNKIKFDHEKSSMINFIKSYYDKLLIKRPLKKGETLISPEFKHLFDIKAGDVATLKNKIKEI